MPFAAHGDFALRQEGRLLMSDLTGPWNLELVDRYRVEVAPHVARLAAGGPWAQIAVCHRSVLAPQDALQALADSARLLAGQYHRVAIAYVLPPEVEGHGIMESVFDRLYKGFQAVACFDALAPACAWALAQVDAARPRG
ncbi:MAG: hypothetical protein DWQ11_06560 [Proteobacteria bacterium]|nr:MAG: hypothetical protein DWQ11_06560 [Pseudomonadota bacterium]